jgi:hypothetical protein
MAPASGMPARLEFLNQKTFFMKLSFITNCIFIASCILLLIACSKKDGLSVTETGAIPFHKEYAAKNDTPYGKKPVYHPVPINDNPVEIIIIPAAKDDTPYGRY